VFAVGRCKSSAGRILKNNKIELLLKRMTFLLSPPHFLLFSFLIHSRVVQNFTKLNGDKYPAPHFRHNNFMGIINLMEGNRESIHRVLC